MRLTVRSCEWMGDWYVIERAEHDGRTWMEPTPSGASLQCSARFSDADVEGPAAEMHLIADAIERRSSAYRKRCAVEVVGEEVRFFSPRNTVGEHGIVTLAEADALAALIRQQVPTPLVTP